MTLLKLEFKSLFRGMLVWGGILALMLIVFMAFFPFMESSVIQDLVGRKPDAVSSPLVEVFGLGDTPEFNNITVYFAYIMQYINIVIAIYAGILGTNALIKEETDGTIEYLYAQVITRNRIVAGKFLANFCTYGFLVFLLWMVSASLNLVFSSGKQEVIEMLLNVNRIYMGTFLIGFIFMTMGFLVSVKLPNAKQTFGWAMAMVFGTSIIGVLSTLVDPVDFLKYLSPLDLFKPNLIIISGFNMKAVGLWSGVMILVMTLTFVLYKKKDLMVSL